VHVRLRHQALLDPALHVGELALGVRGPLPVIGGTTLGLELARELIAKVLSCDHSFHLAGRQNCLNLTKPKAPG
jgi:hypothetical protein